MQEYKTLKDLIKIFLLFNTFQCDEKSVTEIAKGLGMLPSKASRMLGTIILGQRPEDRPFRRNESRVQSCPLSRLKNGKIELIK